MKHREIRKKFLDFFSSRGGAAGGNHKIAASSSLISDDSSVLLTTAGMQQFKPYYLGEKDAQKDFGSKNAVSVQKCFRTSDIDEVGDETHLTFFEMMGNFSFGGYLKKEAITFAYEFIAKELGLEISYVSIFKGSENLPKDEESRKIWQDLGVKNIREEGLKETFWGPTGKEGPCGPTTEIYCKNAGGQDVEIWNIVFNQFFFSGSREELLAGDSGKKLEPLEPAGVDTGMGLERLAMVVQGALTIFDADLFDFVFSKLPAAMNIRAKRIFSDHLRGIVFLISDGVRPSNKEAGYLLRRLIRRLVVYEKYQINVSSFFEPLIEEYGDFYPELNLKIVSKVFAEERAKFSGTLRAGLNKIKKMKIIDLKAAFNLYQSFGLPYEIIKEIGGDRAESLTREDFEKEFEKHREISRAGAEKKFKGGLAGTDAMSIKYHTATHLLHQVLRQILGQHAAQKGSNITAERLRFDFSHPRKLTEEEKQKVEETVNQKIKEALPVSFEEMSVEEAKKTGALGIFERKYGDQVKVYKIGGFSKEICGGPHVNNTGELGHFKIKKEEAVAAGVRRIKAVLE
ncbi:MAG: alanine--tRNA ligase [Patescibacteria group bacterium]